MKFWAALAAAFFLAFCLGCQSAPFGGEVMKKEGPFISAAASLADAMKDIGALYEREQGEKPVYNFGGSGALEAQIRRGAPADIFISAAEGQMDALEKEGLIVKASRMDLLANKVVLVTAKGASARFQTFGDTLFARRIALGDPQGVPAGGYARQVFAYLGILAKVEAKAVYGADVRQVLAWVESGEAEAGVVYATDAAASGKVETVCEAPAGSHAPVVYPAAVVKNGGHREAAEKFMAFLRKPEARAVFEKYGFAVQ